MPEFESCTKQLHSQGSCRKTLSAVAQLGKGDRKTDTMTSARKRRSAVRIAAVSSERFLVQRSAPCRVRGMM